MILMLAHGTCGLAHHAAFQETAPARIIALRALACWIPALSKTLSALDQPGSPCARLPAGLLRGALPQNRLANRWHPVSRSIQPADRVLT